MPWNFRCWRIYPFLVRRKYLVPPEAALLSCSEVFFIEIAFPHVCSPVNLLHIFWIFFIRTLMQGCFYTTNLLLTVALCSIWKVASTQVFSLFFRGLHFVVFTFQSTFKPFVKDYQIFNHPESSLSFGNNIKSVTGSKNLRPLY